MRRATRNTAGLSIARLLLLARVRDDPSRNFRSYVNHVNIPLNLKNQWKILRYNIILSYFDATYALLRVGDCPFKFNCINTGFHTYNRRIRNTANKSRSLLLVRILKSWEDNEIWQCNNEWNNVMNIFPDSQRPINLPRQTYPLCILCKV